MAESKFERAVRLRAIAAEFRANSAQTEWPAYRERMLEMANDLDLEAAKLDNYRLYSFPSARAS